MIARQKAYNGRSVTINPYIFWYIISYILVIELLVNSYAFTIAI